MTTRTGTGWRAALACGSLFVALALVPAAAEENDGPAGKRGAARTVAGDRWAKVNEDGTLARGKGVVSVVQRNPGTYEVVFDIDVSECVYVASVAHNTTGSVFQPIPKPRQIGVAALGDANGVFVRTYRSVGNTPEDTPFHLFVGCG